MSITAEQILDALRHVDDPDLRKDIVTLGMVRNLQINGNKVSFDVVLTTPACPMKDAIRNACITAVRHLVSNELEVEPNMTSETTSTRSGNAFLPRVKNIIAVASGKGGVGKSTVAANLATGLALSGASVGLIDADIYGPSQPILFGIQGRIPEMAGPEDKPIMVPVQSHGVKVISVGLLVKADQAIVWRGPMVSTALRQLCNDVDWGDLDYLIIDLPPGTGDIHLTMVQSIPLTGVLIVTTPQEVALADTRKAANMFRIPQIEKPILGIVENMSWFEPAELPGARYHLFGKGGGKKLAEELQVPLLAEVPLYAGLAEQADMGLLSVLDVNRPDGQAFQEMAKKVARQIALVNAGVINEEQPG